MCRPRENKVAQLANRAASAMKLARCGRCRWWEGHRFCNNMQTTVSFAVEAACFNSGAPLKWAIAPGRVPRRGVESD